MAETKKKKSTTTSKKSNTAKKTAAKTSASSKNVRASSVKRKKRYTKEQLEIRTQRFSIILFAVAILTFAIIFIKGESVWLALHNFMLGLFGACAISVPVLFFYIAVVTAMNKLGGKLAPKVWLVIFTVLLISTSIYTFRFHLLPTNVTYFEMLHDLYLRGTQRESLGLISGVLGYPLASLLGKIGSRIFVILLLFVCVMFLTGTTLPVLFVTVKKPVVKVAENIEQTIEERKAIKQDLLSSDIDIPLTDTKKNTDAPLPVAEAFKLPETDNSSKLNRLYKAHEDLTGQHHSYAESPVYNESAPSNLTIEDLEKKLGAETPKPVRKKKTETIEPVSVEEVSAEIEENQEEQLPEYIFPPTSLLEYTRNLDAKLDEAETRNTAQNLVDTLKSFGVSTSVIGVSKGPTVTRYELSPAVGVKISRITNLVDDLALNLAASAIRIEAPIPGKAAVGIEIANKTKLMVRMREMVESSTFINAKSNLTVVLGRDIAGQFVFADLAKMPHLLIAGATGSGKSVLVNSFILSVLYKAKPSDVKMIMIDPKMVELPIYNGIPHLLIPVVTDPKKAAGTLNWAVGEMTKRYNIFAETGVRDIEGYNKLIETGSLTDLEGNVREKMSQILIVIDELADLMMVAGKDVESSICRLAQLARAAGIHLVVATQRPSVDVITGLIKANIPSRIALTVASATDSRTILESGGAEKLLGYGDMLFAPVGSNENAKRVQGCYISDEERESIINFVKQSSAENVYDEKIAKEIENAALLADSGKNSKGGASSEDGGGLSDSDPILEEAIELAVDSGQISTSALQRRFRLGYARAGRVVDTMEQMGIVGPSEGSKPRKVLITKAQWLERNMLKSDNQGEYTDESFEG